MKAALVILQFGVNMPSLLQIVLYFFDYLLASRPQYLGIGDFEGHEFGQLRTATHCGKQKLSPNSKERICEFIVFIVVE